MMTKRQKKRAANRGILIIRDKVDRGRLILEDPDSYFAAARERAEAEARRELERRLTKA